MGLVEAGLDPKTKAFYQRTLAVLNEAGPPFLVGGAYALTKHAGIERHTKDLDVFIRRADRDPMLRALEAAGYQTEATFPHWLAKAYEDDAFIDLIYSSGNGVSEVDDEWFAHAADGEVMGVPVKLCPAEEMIWSKAFIQERERFDGADVAHLIRSRGRGLDWERLLRRFGDKWRILFGHLVTFGFIYPAERDCIPPWVLKRLAARLSEELECQPPPEPAKVCFGTLLSREQYLPDIGLWGYRDARLEPIGSMSPEAVAHWTAAIAGKA
ncbi:hypothetical protein OJF2_73860 [Aquisphaera giovannonii]|uniref:Nucleotidyltransferase family protein n=1 Tax=Aquisphaera giovannonii TaxID=406548 RepID=A0A5B9WFV5_9BACT|nr:nucleotidyltransferase [Aquisphaera giovannonii]QEH38780.1 hypothetical protein OJF2_73860 [Aquisphaera giovannonii]